MNTVYHGSKKGGIKTLTPSSHKAIPGKEVVFATTDKRYAIAMIYGTGNELAVSFLNDKDMYIDELQEGRLDLLNNTGYVYELDSSCFKESPEKLKKEFVSYSEIPTLKEEKIENIKEHLMSLGVHLIPYKQVPESMQERNKNPFKPYLEHEEGRFNV